MLKAEIAPSLEAWEIPSHFCIGVRREILSMLEGLDCRGACECRSLHSAAKVVYFSSTRNQASFCLSGQPWSSAENCGRLRGLLRRKQVVSERKRKIFRKLIVSHEGGMAPILESFEREMPHVQIHLSASVAVVQGRSHITGHYRISK